MKKALRVTSAIIVSLILLGLLIGTIFFAISYTKYSKVDFDKNALVSETLAINIYDNNNRKLKENNMFNPNFVKVDTIKPYTKQAFISIEDKKFYSHSGINLKRMAKASLTNLKEMKFKEGASTISQQLIKNTHLSNEKTFSRKLKEIALTKKLEKAFTKNEILELYLNVIYFGSNTYGIEEASNYYFSKPSKDLTISESAMLAGMIKSPNYYSPIRHLERTTKRRNTVLFEMYKDGVIDFQTYLNAKNETINLNINSKKSNKLNTYSECALDEASKILKLPAKQIALGKYKIYTYLNKEKQQALENALSNSDEKCDKAGIVIDPKTFGVTAYHGNSNYKIIDVKRQPGSLVKPILVYAPALNENIISPLTQILDEPLNISGYKPKNVGGNYNGYVSVREAVKKSINIPSIKVMSYVGIEKAKQYGENLGIKFVKEDANYALALGGMTYGTNILEITNAYAPLSNGGDFEEAKFISYIQDSKGKIIYRHEPNAKKVFREDTAYLMTDILKDAASEGTARKLSPLGFDIASKTGTVQKPNSNLNLDAWNVSYTSEDVLGIWFGNMDNAGISIAGGNQPTKCAKEFFSENNKIPPKPFSKPSSIRELEIDTLELTKNHTVKKANDFLPDRFKITEIFSSFNLPKEESKSFISLSPAKLNGVVENGNAILTFEADELLEYYLYKNVNGKDILLKSFVGKSGEQEYKDLMRKNKEEYYLLTKIKNYANGNVVVSDKSIITLYDKDAKEKKWYV